MKGYYDYAATTPLDEDVLEAMRPYFCETFGNADSLHAFGRNAANALSRSRDQVAELLGVSAGEVYFVSGGTEADNWAVRGMGDGQAAVSAIEHVAVLEGAKWRAGGFVSVPATHGGIITPEAIASVLGANTGLACVMAVNNETGCIQPLREISALCKERGVLLFSDCVQAAGVLDLKELASLCDGLALSAHKIYGPKGVGALVVKRGVKLRPLVAGGEQERGLRGGTSNVGGAVGFALALQKAQREREENNRKILRARGLFESRLLQELREEVVFDGENRAAHISHVTLQKGGGALLARLDLSGVACSGGSACSAHVQKPSHVLLAMGRSEEEAKGGLRFSFGKDATEADALFAADALIACYRAIGE